MASQNIETLCDIVVSNEMGSHKSVNFGEMTCSIVDFTPVLSQLPTGFCQVPHWGYMINGQLDMSFSDGSEESIKTGEIFYMKPGHTGVLAEDSKFVEFSPKDDMVKLLDFFKEKM